MSNWELCEKRADLLKMKKNYLWNYSFDLKKLKKYIINSCWVDKNLFQFLANLDLLSIYTEMLKKKKDYFLLTIYDRTL